MTTSSDSFDSSDESTSKRRRVDDAEEYMDGAIVRIKLRNFVTYDHVEFTLGPNLNMIIGPNGSGKSSIVCAIALGLAGKPDLLGRAKGLRDFVKHGAEIAYIELELKNQPHNLVIARQFTATSNTSTWFLNSNLSSEKTVKEQLKKLNVQVDNLCSFLPQDKVCEFAQMTPQELLKETERAVGSPDLIQSHDKLIELNKKEKIEYSGLITEKSDLEKRRTQLMNLQREVEKIQERAENLKKIHLVNGAIEFKRYEEKKVIMLEKKELYLKMKNQVEEKYSQNKPLQDKMQELNKEKEESSGKIEKLRSKMSEYTQGLQNFATSITSELNAIEDGKNELSNLDKRDKQRRKNIEKYKQELEKDEKNVEVLKNQLVQVGLVNRSGDIDQKFTPLGELKELITYGEELERQLSHISQQIDTVNEEIENLDGTAEGYRNIQRETNKRIQALNTIEGRNLEILRSESPDSYRAYQWVQENPNLFQKPVLGPICLLISPSEPKFADSIENHLSKNALLTFVCLCEEDYKTFSNNTIEKLKLRTNCVCFKNELNKFTPNTSREEIKRLGFDGFFLDVINAQEEILATLCQMNNIHNSPVAMGEVNMELVEKCATITNFTAAGYRHVISRGYGGVSTRTMAVKQSRILANNVHSDELDKLREKLENNQKDLNECEVRSKAFISEKKKLSENFKSIDMKKQETAQRIKVFYDQQKYYKRSMQEIETKRMALSELMQPSADARSQRQLVASRIRDHALLASKNSLLFSSMQESCVRIYRARNKILLNQTVLQIDIDKIAQQLRSYSLDIANLEAERDSAKKEYESLKAEVLRQVKHVTKLKDEFSAEEMEDIKTKYYESNLEELQVLVATLQARADASAADNQGILDEYEQRKVEVEQMDTDIQAKEALIEDIHTEITELRNSWYPKLVQLIKKINLEFGAAFAGIGCAGEVRLGEHEDYSEWSIEILVKFREGEKLALLTGHRQSGGERSVSTILYLMSLQKITRVPFRVVDEINQGMDPRNERCVHAQLVRSACVRNTSQYLLITPKLLPDLRYEERMKVLCVFNSEHQPEKFDTRSVLAQYKALKAQ